MTAASNLLKVLWQPSAVFESLGDRKSWVVAAILLLATAVLFAALSAPAQTKLALVQMEERADEMPPGQIESAKRFMNSPAIVVFAAFAAAATGAIGIIIKSGLFHLGAVTLGGRAGFLGAISVIVYSSAPLMVRNILGSLTISSTGEPVAEGLSALMPLEERMSALGAFAAGIDLFALWSVALGAIGLAIIYKLDRKKALLVSGGFWATAMALRVGMTAVSSGLTGM